MKHFEQKGVGPVGPVHFSLIIPTFKNPEHIQACLEGVCEVLDTYIPQKYEIIIVADKNTLETARTFNSTYPQLQVVPEKENAQPSVSAGWHIARGDILGIIDGDLEYTPTSLVPLLEEIENGADLAITSQYYDTNAPEKKDPSIGCCAVRRERMDNAQFSATGYEILLDALGKEGMKNMKDAMGTAKQSNKWKNYFGNVLHLFNVRT